MKKTLATLLMAGASAWAATDLNTIVTYTWISTENGTTTVDVSSAVTSSGATLQDTAGEGTYTAGYTSVFGYTERGGQAQYMYDFVMDALNQDSDHSLIFDLTLATNGGGDHPDWGTTLFHQGRNNTGLSLNIINGTLYLGKKDSEKVYKLGTLKTYTLGSEPTTSDFNTISVVISGGTVSATINDVLTADAITLPAADSEDWGWYSNTNTDTEKGMELYSFSLGNQAPGYGNNMSNQGTKIAGYSITHTPEPATATLSLLALAGLAARRRRH